LEFTYISVIVFKIIFINASISSIALSVFILLFVDTERVVIVDTLLLRLVHKEGPGCAGTFLASYRNVPGG